MLARVHVLRKHWTCLQLAALGYDSRSCSVHLGSQRLGSSRRSSQQMLLGRHGHCQAATMLVSTSSVHSGSQRLGSSSRHLLLWSWHGQCHVSREAGACYS